MTDRRRELAPTDALRVLAEALAPYLTELLGLSKTNSVDDWIDVVDALPTCVRAVRRACRVGALPGRKIKRRWLVRRADLDAWIESHETGTKPPPTEFGAAPGRALTPAEELGRNEDLVLKQLGMRRLTNAERAAKGMPPYDVNRAYIEHLEREKQREKERAERERADNDPKIAAQRAVAVRAADAGRRGRPTRLPRVRCGRCDREVAVRKDGDPVAHACPHKHGYSCRDSENGDGGVAPHCPWCAKERAEREATAPCRG